MDTIGPQQLEIRRFFLFIVVGCFSAVSSLAVRGALSHIVFFEFAVAVAHLVGLTIAFTLGRIFVFTNFSGSLWAAYRRFFLVNLLSLAIATVASALFYRSALPVIGWKIYPDYTAHFLGLGCAAIPSYLGHRFYSFRREEPVLSHRSKYAKER
jgi:putative flippase GtrA